MEMGGGSASGSIPGPPPKVGVMENTYSAKPITHQRNLAKLPKALAPLTERPQWCVWRWTQKPDGSWQKPPFMALQPDRHASTNDPETWTDYAKALATVQAGHADGISYILTNNDPFGAIDLDRCRCLVTHSIDIWAQNYLQAAVNTYQEITPSGEGVRIWGIADGDPLNRKFTLNIEGKDIAAELFRKPTRH
jgi:primase-polymerase (primpol)-like protein